MGVARLKSSSPGSMQAFANLVTAKRMPACVLLARNSSVPTAECFLDVVLHLKVGSFLFVFWAASCCGKNMISKGKVWFLFPMHHQDCSLCACWECLYEWLPCWWILLCRKNHCAAPRKFTCWNQLSTDSSNIFSMVLLLPKQSRLLMQNISCSPHVCCA